jgi:Putative adhesin
MTKTIAAALFCVATVLAQDGGEKATVPLHDPSRPARIHANLLTGGITVRGADIKNVVVETNPRGEEHHRREPRSDGMRRLDLPGNAGLEVTEDDNVVRIKAAPWGRPADLLITVPRHSSLELKTLNDGDIYVEQVDGEIDANDLNGKITLKNVGGAVVAHSLNGAVLATLNHIDSGKPMSFSTMNGDIDVTLPPDVKANVAMKTDNGEIYSDFEVKLEAGTHVVPGESGRQANGSYRLHFDRMLRGTINGGGPEFQLISFNGQIFIRKQK